MCRVVIFESIHTSGIAALKKSFDVEIALGVSRDEQLKKAETADAVVIRSVTQIDQAFLDAAPSLKAIGRAGTGTDNIDLPAAAKRGVHVLTVPEGNTNAVAELTLMQMMAARRRLIEVLEATRRGDFRREFYQGTEMQGAVVGLIGLGRIGTRVAQLLRPFGCRVLGFDIDPARKEAFIQEGGQWCADRSELIRECDILSVHVPKTSETSPLIGAEELSLLKQGAWVINTSRGGIIDEAALLKAVNAGALSGASVDVLDQEPPFDAEPGSFAFKHPFLDHPRIWVTPHFGASTDEAQRRIAQSLAAALKRTLKPNKFYAAT